jgi:hypothetical protein
MIILAEQLDGFLIEYEDLFYLNADISILFYQIIVIDLYDPKTKYIATCNKWLAKNEDDGQIFRDLILHKETGGIRKGKERNLN